MKNSILISVLLLFSSVLFSQGTIEINVSNLSNDKGQIIVSLFKKGQRFGNNKEPFRKIKYNKIANKKASFIIENIEEGEYAFIIFHDEDKNEKLKTNWIGMPKEGIGKSGNQKRRPSYENSKFTFSGEKMSFHIKLKYL